MVLSTLAAGWPRRDPSSDPRVVQDGPLATLWSCQLVSMQGLLCSSRSFACHLPCTQLRSGTVDENKQEAEPKVWQMLDHAAWNLLQRLRGRKEAILSLSSVNK